MATVQPGCSLSSDHIGRPVFATNAAGVKTWTERYLPFCGVRTSTGTPTNTRFPGKWYQSKSGLHQNWMRDYDPTSGRYLQGDPLGLIDGASVYGYVRQNPGRYVDPRGEHPAVAAVASICESFPAACAKIADICISAVIAGTMWVLGEEVLAPQMTEPDEAICENCTAMKPHKKGARKSTKPRYEEGDARRGRDRGGEKGDEVRDPTRKPPPDFKGSWPPKPKPQ